MKFHFYPPIEGWEDQIFVIYCKKLTQYHNKLNLLLSKVNCSKKIAFTCFLSFVICLNAYSTIRTTVANGNWSSSSKWSPAGVPANGDTVIISSGHTIRINTNTNNIASIIIDGTLIIGNNNTNRTITVINDITINSGGVFNTAGNGGNNLIVGGHILNNGIFDMHIGSAAADVTFNGSYNQLIDGVGSTTDFYTIEVNNTGSANNNIVEIASDDFTAVTGFLTLTKGILKMSGNYTFSNTFFNTASPTINADEGLWLNNTNVTVTAQNGGTLLSGSIHITEGTYNIGTTTNNYLAFKTGATFTMEGGALNISGVFSGNSTTESITYNQSGGTVTVCTAGNTYSSFASFDIRASGNVFTMSGGAIVIEQPATYYYDYINTSSHLTITGGEISAGNASTSASSLFYFWSPVNYSLTVFNANVTCRLYTNTNVLHDIYIGGVLDIATANVKLSVGHNWTNDGSFLPGTDTVHFNGTTSQLIGGSVSSTFGNVKINNTGGGGIILGITTYIEGSCNFTTGVLTSTSSKMLVFKDNAIATNANNNISDPSYVNGPVKKIGDDAFTFPVGKTGAGYRLCAISAPANITDAFTVEFMRASAIALGSISAAGLYQVSNCEYWNINRDAGSSSINVTLSWSGLSNCNAAAYVNNLTSLVVAHFNGSNWNSYGEDSYTGNVSSGTLTWNSVSSFSSFSLGSTSYTTNPLPVTFSNIHAFPLGINNRVEWTNQTGIGIEEYQVEKSIDGRNFVNMCNVPAKNTGFKEDYFTIDYSVTSNTTWYRVKAKDATGIITYGPVVKVIRQAPNDLELNIYPNIITNNQFTIKQENRWRSNALITIVNMSGQQVFKANWQHRDGSDTKQIILPVGIVPGYYIVNIYTEGKSLKGKIVVQ